MTRYRINAPRVITETIAGEAVMIDLDTGTYYSLDAVGAVIWDELARGVDVEGVVAMLETGYDASHDELTNIVTGLVSELEREHLVVHLNGDAPEQVPTPSSIEASERRSLTRPELHKFTDMQDLVLLDPVHEVDERGWPHPKPEE